MGYHCKKDENNQKMPKSKSQKKKKKMRSSGTCPVVSASMPGMPICLVGEGLRTPVLTVAQLRRRFRNVIAFMLETRRVVLCRGRSHAVFAVDGTLYTENRSVGMHALVLLFTCTSFCGLRSGGTLRCPEADGNHFVEFCPRPRLFFLSLKWPVWNWLVPPPGRGWATGMVGALL